MAQTRELVKRRKAVRNIRKITRTMQLIATARFQAALNRATAARPYAERLAELVADLSAVAPDVRHPLLQKPEGVDRSVLLVLTSMRGLCGGYNANVLRTAVGHLNNNAERGTETDTYMVGRKGIAYFRFLRRPMAEELTHIGDKPVFGEVEAVANGLMDRYAAGEIAGVHVAYMRFHSVGRQKPEVLQLLPLSREFAGNGRSGTVGSSAKTATQYDFSPDPAELLGELLPATVRNRLFQCFNDAAVSEQISRMVAMKAATDAAADMIDLITRRYNRARQTQITMELLDIVGGANALE